MAICVKCGATIPDDAVFCQFCGDRIDGAASSDKATPGFCGQCGLSLPENAAFCPTCGAPRGGRGAHIPSDFSDHLAWSIVSTVIFFPIGLGALIFTLLARDSAGRGDIAKAREFAGIAHAWNIVLLIIASGSFFFSILGATLFFIFGFFN